MSPREENLHRRSGEDGENGVDAILYASFLREENLKNSLVNPRRLSRQR